MGATARRRGMTCQAIFTRVEGGGKENHFTAVTLEKTGDRPDGKDSVGTEERYRQLGILP